MRRRDRHDIYADMLTAIRDSDGGKIKPTRLMYKANISYPQLKNFLGQLLDKGLVEKTNVKNHDYIALTGKGFSYISQYIKVKEFEGSFGLD